MSSFVLLVLFFLHIAASSYGLNDKESIAYAENTLEDKHGKIIYASVVFRHGDRAVENDYPTDPNPPSVWPQGYGQLTKFGKNEEYMLGKWLRERYGNNLIIGGYSPNIVTINSSDYDRTLMSAELVLAGLFPPSEKEMWNEENLKWLPIPVHTIPRDYDHVIAAEAPCQRYDLEVCLLNDSPELEAYYQENRHVFEYASSHSGFEISSDDVFGAVVKMRKIYDALYIEHLHNLTIPNWAKKIYPQPLKSMSEFYLRMIVYSREMERLSGGPLLGLMVSDMQKKINSSMNQTLHLYSGHDTTISMFLCTLGIFNSINPPYSSSVIVELRQNVNDYFVTILYRNSTTEEPYFLRIPGCDEVCSLNDFIHLTKDLIPENWYDECQVNLFEKIMRVTPLNFIVIIFIICFMLILLGIIIKRLHLFKKRRNKQYRMIVNDVLSNEEFVD